MASARSVNASSPKVRPEASWSEGKAIIGFVVGTLMQESFRELLGVRPSRVKQLGKRGEYRFWRAPDRTSARPATGATSEGGPKSCAALSSWTGQICGHPEPWDPPQFWNLEDPGGPGSRQYPESRFRRLEDQA